MNSTALTFGVLSALFWGTHSVIVRYLTDHAHGLVIAMLRLYIAALVLYLILKIYKHPVSFNFKDRYFLLTVFGSVTNYIFFHVGLEHTTAANAMVLENTAPFFVLVFLVLVLKERINKWEWIATLIVIFGVYFTIRHDFTVGGERWVGDLEELLAGLTWGIFILGSSKALQNTESTIERIAFLFNVFLVSALFLTPLCLFYIDDFYTITSNDIVFLIALGVFPTAIAYWLWYEAAARISTLPASLLFTLTIVFTLVNAHLFLGEQITIDMLIGSALVILGVGLSKLGAKRA